MPLHMLVSPLKMLFFLSIQIWLKSPLSWMLPAPLQPRRPFLGSSPALFFESHTSSFIASYLKSLLSFRQEQGLLSMSASRAEAGSQVFRLLFSSSCPAPVPSTALQTPLSQLLLTKNQISNNSSGHSGLSKHHPL